MLSNSERVQLADKKEVLEFHLEWVSLCVLCRNSASGEELSEEMQLQFDDLALRMAQFILNYEKKRLDEASHFASQFSKTMTRRQREIVQLLAEGRPNREIADVLGISEKTVEFHRRHIRELFNLHNNADIVLFALKQGLISLNPSSSDSPK
jgi:DNA-binding CsgD family transcriptional regulator